MAIKRLDKIATWRYEGLDSFGDSTFADAAEEIDARWADYQGVRVDSSGQQYVAMGVIYDDQNSFKVNDRVIDKPIASAELSETFIIRAIKRSRNVAGTRVLYAAYFSK